MSRNAKHPKPSKSRKRGSVPPSFAVEHGLDMFRRRRAQSLIDGSHLGYYLKQAHDDMRAFSTYYADAPEDGGEGHGDPILFKPWPQFDSPKKHLRSVAVTIGWRVIPFGRWASNKLGDASIARDIERDVRRWCDEADAVWARLEAAPKGRKNWPAQAALMRPLVLNLLGMLDGLREAAAKYPDLRVQPPQPCHTAHPARSERLRELLNDDEA